MPDVQEKWERGDQEMGLGRETGGWDWGEGAGETGLEETGFM